MLGHGQVITGYSFLWDVIIHLCHYSNHWSLNRHCTWNMGWVFTSRCLNTLTFQLAFAYLPLIAKVHGANMGPSWGRQDPGGPHFDLMNFAIWVLRYLSKRYQIICFGNILECTFLSTFLFTITLSHDISSRVQSRDTYWMVVGHGNLWQSSQGRYEMFCVFVCVLSVCHVRVSSLAKVWFPCHDWNKSNHGEEFLVR